MIRRDNGAARGVAVIATPILSELAARLLQPEVDRQFPRRAIGADSRAPDYLRAMRPHWPELEICLPTGTPRVWNG
jgi:hypothetical protein